MPRRKIGFQPPPKKRAAPSLDVQPHAGQRAILELPGRFKIAVCGRKFGKTVVGAIAAVNKIDCNNAAQVMWVMPTEDQARVPIRQLEEWLRPKLWSTTNRKAKWRLARSELAFTHQGGGRIEFRSAEQGEGLRGPGLDLLIVDEAASVAERVWQEILLPMLLIKKGEAILLGTPAGKSNWLHRQFEKALHSPNWSRYQAPSTANPEITEETLKIFRDEMPSEIFRQEILAEFLDSAGAVFPGVDAQPRCELHTQGLPGHSYALGIDIGRVNDFTVCIAVDNATGEANGLERWSGTPWPITAARITDFHRRFPGQGYIDATGLGSAIAEHMHEQSAGLLKPFTFTETSRQTTLSRLAVSWEHFQVKIPNVPELCNELRAFEWKTERSEEGFSSAKPRTTAAFDDCVMALGLAWRMYQSCAQQEAKKRRRPKGPTGNPLQADGFFGGQPNRKDGALEELEQQRKRERKRENEKAEKAIQVPKN